MQTINALVRTVAAYIFGSLLIAGCSPALAQPSEQKPTRFFERTASDLGWVDLLFAKVAWAKAEAAPAQRDALADEVFIALQRAGSTRTGLAVVQTAARFAAGSGPLAASVRRLQDANEEISALELGMGAAIADEDRDRVAIIKSRLVALVATRKSTEEQIARDFPAYAALIGQSTASRQDIQQLLGPDEALLFMVPTGDGTHVFVLTAERVRWQLVSDSAEAISAAVRGIRCTLVVKPDCQGRLLAQPHPFAQKEARDLYRSLLQPFADLLADKPELFVVARGPLSSLPLSLLVMEGPDAQPVWLADRHAVTVLPAVVSLKILRAGPLARRSQADGGFIGFGAPDLLPDPPAGPPGAIDSDQRGARRADVFRGAASLPVAVANPVALREGFDDLPFAAGELTAMRSALGGSAARVVLGSGATEAAVRNQSFGEVRVAAFATHAFLSTEVAGFPEPGLVFTPPSHPSRDDDGVLSASEAAQLDMPVEWLILSACNTAGPSGSANAEGLSGLARSFLYAGAHSLLVSHWPVFDGVAAELTVKTIAAWQANPTLSRSEALRRAMSEIRNDRQDDLSHPIYWAPFILVGENRH